MKEECLQSVQVQVGSFSMIFCYSMLRGVAYLHQM